MGYDFETLLGCEGEDLAEAYDRAVSDYQERELEETQVEDVINLEDFLYLGDVFCEVPYQLDPAFLHFILLNCYKKIKNFEYADYKFSDAGLIRENPHYFFQGENNISITIEYQENKMLFLADTKEGEEFIQKVKEKVFENTDNIELSSKWLAVARIADHQVICYSFQRLKESKPDKIYNEQDVSNGKSYNFGDFMVTCYNNGTILTQGGFLVHEEYFSLQTFWLAVLEKVFL
ncbi:hypothetical protein [Streptococcus constellatus]|uniref:hypothetical protein n=1 Tax=Streptococcus constellatus TaxID=76860 RepID=UPI00123ABDE7|nr:hypothetical protein [Streptococcus constellatus]